MEIINDRQLINLGIICLLAEGKEVTNRRLVDGTFWQDKRLIMWGRLLEMIDAQWTKLPLAQILTTKWNQQNLVGRDGYPPNWRSVLEAMILEASVYERVVTPLYEHKNEYYIVNPGEVDEMSLYYNLSPAMVIEASRCLIGDEIWFLGQHEIFTELFYDSEIDEVRSKYRRTAKQSDV